METRRNAYRSYTKSGVVGLSLALALVAGSSAQAMSPRDDQTSVREGANSGKLLSLASIVAMVQRQPGFRNMTFLGGGEFNERNQTYRLKFMEGKRVVFVDVDARTGRILSSAR